MATCARPSIWPCFDWPTSDPAAHPSKGEMTPHPWAGCRTRTASSACHRSSSSARPRRRHPLQACRGRAAPSAPVCHRPVAAVSCQASTTITSSRSCSHAASHAPRRASATGPVIRSCCTPGLRHRRSRRRCRRTRRRRTRSSCRMRSFRTLIRASHLGAALGRARTHTRSARASCRSKYHRMRPHYTFRSNRPLRLDIHRHPRRAPR